MTQLSTIGPLPYSWWNLTLVAVQALLVALPAAGLPAFARRFAGRSWSLVLPLSISVVVAVLAVLPGAAVGLTWLALVATPPLAAAALGWGAHGARPWLATLAVPALVAAVVWEGERAGQVGALFVTALSCVALGRLLVGAVDAVAGGDDDAEVPSGDAGGRAAGASPGEVGGDEAGPRPGEAGDGEAEVPSGDAGGRAAGASPGEVGGDEAGTPPGEAGDGGAGERVEAGGAVAVRRPEGDASPSGVPRLDRGGTPEAPGSAALDRRVRGADAATRAASSAARLRDGLARLAHALPATAWIRIALVAMAVIDAILVFSGGLQAPNRALNAAVPADELPRLQFVQFGYASMGYGDVFVAGVLGALLAAEGVRRRTQALAALVTFGLSLVFDLLFWVVDTLPATVPVAVALLLFGGWRGPARDPRRRIARS